MPSNVDLIIPGLFGPVPLPPELAPDTPALNLLLARGTCSAGGDSDLTTTLCRRFGVDASAPYALAVDDPCWDRTGFRMHADPVHLRPDRDLLRLFDARHLDISQAEADALVAELNAHFGADDLCFEAPLAARWFLRCEPPPRLDTAPLERVIGQHIDGLLPTGADAGRWAGLMNEAQMLLFQSDVNQRRERQGRPAVNGLWLSGGGVWQAPVTAQLPTRVLADRALACGLGQAAGAQVDALSSATDWSRASGITLLVWDALLDAVLDADERAWVAALERLERDLAAPVLDALRSGRLDALSIDACDGRQWRLRRGDLRRFWRRPRPMASRLLPPR